MKKSKSGQAMSEYLILTALIAIGSIAVVQLLGTNIQRRMATISEAIRGEKKVFEGKKAEERHYEVRDLGDFSEGFEDKDQK